MREATTAISADAKLSADSKQLRHGLSPDRFTIRSFSAFALPIFVLATGCHSYHVETTVENRTGAPIHQLEVDYPSASFGQNTIATGAEFHYRIQVLGQGHLQVQYTAEDGRQRQIDGPTLSEHQQGKLEIVLLPEGKAEFHPELTPAH